MCFVGEFVASTVPSLVSSFYMPSVAAEPGSASRDLSTLVGSMFVPSLERIHRCQPEGKGYRSGLIGVLVGILFLWLLCQGR